MLTEEQHAAIRDAINRVCNRESDREDTHDGGLVVRRSRGGDIACVLVGSSWDLEPDDGEEPD